MLMIQARTGKRGAIKKNVSNKTTATTTVLIKIVASPSLCILICKIEGSKLGIDQYVAIDITII